jgi:hypothetical protein
LLLRLTPTINSFHAHGTNSRRFLYELFTKSTAEAQAALYRNPLVTSTHREILRC